MHIFGVHSLFCFRKLKFENIGVVNAVIGDNVPPYRIIVRPIQSN